MVLIVVCLHTPDIVTAGATGVGITRTVFAVSSISRERDRLFYWGVWGLRLAMTGALGCQQLCARLFVRFRLGHCLIENRLVRASWLPGQYPRGRLGSGQ